MRPRTWRISITIAVGVSLLIGLVALGFALGDWHKADDNNASVNALKASVKVATLNDAVPATSIIAPLPEATVSGTVSLDAKPLGPSVKNVEFEVSSNGSHNAKIGTAIPSLVGWLLKWQTTSVPNGTYELTSVGYNPDGRNSRSSSVTVHVLNP